MYKAGEKSITIYDVARGAGVSMATVSRVINGSPNVRPTTRKKVLDIITKLDFRPNAVARGLASNKTATIGVVIPDISEIFFSSLASGIDDIATMYKYNILLGNSDGDNIKEISVLNTLLAKQVDGVIFMGYRVVDEVRRELAHSKTPVVLAATVDSGGELASVNIDYRIASFDATNVLAKNQHRKIALISGPITDPINQERLCGYQESLAQNNIEFQRKLVFEMNYSFQKGRDFATRLKKSGATAAFVTNDELALGVLDGLMDLGVNIPKDFEIITSNNSVLTEYARPRISSITQSLYDLGAVAMRLLIKLINDEEIEEKQIVLTHEIEKKGTTN